jgi:hypothetical protein
MKATYFLALLTGLAVSLFASTGHAMDITAIASGDWSDTNIWDSGTVPGPNDDTDIPGGISVTVDTNVVVQFIYDSGTVIMGTNSSLNLTTDSAIATGTTLLTTAPSNTVIYSGNPFFAKQCNYYNLELANTNYVDAYPPYYPFEDFNNFSSSAGPTPMTIAGNMTVMGAIKVQQGSGGAPITIEGNLNIGTNCIWDCSGDNLTVMGNLYVYGLLEDLNGALGTNYVNGNVLISGVGHSGYSAATGLGTNGWNISDVTTWGVGGSITNDGAIYGVGYGCINFNGAGVITGSNTLKLPTIIISGSYEVGTTILLTTNNATLNGTVVFDLANTNQIILQPFTNAPTTQTTYYSGNLVVVDSDAPPVSGSSYSLFNAANYAGTFAAITLPSLPPGLSWVNNLATSGSIAVTGGSAGSPSITSSQQSGVLTLSWNSTTYPGYVVEAQTNRMGLGTNWMPVAGGGTSPFTIAINPTNPAVFFRLHNP